MFGMFPWRQGSKIQEVIGDRNVTAYIGNMTQETVEMRVAAEAEGVSERQWCVYGVVIIRMAQENLSLKETNG